MAGDTELRPGLGMNIETNCFVGTASGARQPPAQPSPLFHNLQAAKIFCVGAVTRSLAQVSRWTQDPTMEDKWRCPNVPMGHFFVHYDITVSRVPWPGPEYCQRTMGQQSPVRHARCTVGSVEFLSFDIVTIFREGDNLFYGQIKALVAVVEILGCKILRTHQSIDVKMRTPSLDSALLILWTMNRLGGAEKETKTKSFTAALHWLQPGQASP